MGLTEYAFMQLNRRQKRVLTWATNYFRKNKPSSKNKQDALHGIDHAMRVAYWAVYLAHREGGDLEILIPAALLHDVAIPKVGDATHARVGARVCKPVLMKCGYSPREIERISHAIVHHSTDDPNPPLNAEDRLLFDADKLDATGPASLHRWFFEYEKHGFVNVDAMRKTLARLEKWRKRYGPHIFFSQTARRVSKRRLAYIERVCRDVLEDNRKFESFYR